MGTVGLGLLCLPFSPLLTNRLCPNILQNRNGLVLLEQPSVLTSHAKPNVVTVQKDENGHQILIDGEATMLLGMNWGHIPIGQNYSYDFGDSQRIIQTALDREMSLSEIWA